MADVDLEALELDGALVARTAAATEGFGRAQLEASDTHQRVLAGNCLTIAGSYWALLSTARAQRCFEAAALVYRPTDRSFSVTVAICSGKEELLREPGIGVEQASDEVDDLETRLSNLLLASRLVVGGEPSDSAWMLLDRSHLDERQSALPVGRLGVPWAACERVLRSAAGLMSQNRADARRTTSPLLSAVSVYLGRLDEIVFAAMANRYQWHRLLSPVLPVEPEALAVTMVAATAIRNAAQSSLAEVLDLPPRQATMARIADSLVSLGDGDRA